MSDGQPTKYSHGWYAQRFTGLHRQLELLADDNGKCRREMAELVERLDAQASALRDAHAEIGRLTEEVAGLQESVTKAQESMTKAREAFRELRREKQ